MPIRERYQHEHLEGARVGRFNFGINTTFIVYRLGGTLIDTGPANQWSSVRKFISEKPVKRLLLSHHHEDHSGNAARIAREYQLTPLAPELGREKLARGYRTPPVQRFIWGRPKPVETDPLPESLTLEDGTRVEAIHTPGHAKDLHVFFLPEKGWLFSGDLYISRKIRYLRADENLGQIIESIRRVLTLEFETLLCAHRGVLENGREALAEKYQNILHLCEQSQSLAGEGLGLTDIMHKLLGPEDQFARLSGGNFSKANLIKEALAVSL